MEMISFPTLEDRTQSEVALSREGRHPEHDLDKSIERIEIALNKSNSQLMWLLRLRADCVACCLQRKVKE